MKRSTDPLTVITCGASTIRHNDLALCPLAEYARTAGWDAWTPAAAILVPRPLPAVGRHWF
jgi:hypothetical protein